MARTQLILDRYRVVGKAGAGGYGTVLRAYDTHLKRDVAIKCIELSEADVARARLLAMEERLQREAEEREVEGYEAEEHGAGRSEAGERALGGYSAAERGFGGRPAEERPAEEREAEKRELRQSEARECVLGSYSAEEHEARAFGAGRRNGLAKLVKSAKPAKPAKREPLPWEDDPEEVLEDDLDYGYRAWEEDSDGGFEEVADGEASGGVGGSGASDGDFKEAARTAVFADDEDALFPRDPSFLDAREDRLAQSVFRPLFKPDPLAVSPPAVSTALDPADVAPAADAAGAADTALAADVADVADAADAADDDLFDHIPGLAEAQMVAKLNDANIVTVYDCAVEGATAYIIMEYVEGKTLACLMREMGDDISLDVVAAVFTSVAHALEFAHDADVLHLDIKPENVIVNTKGVVKVTDFGLATLMDASGCGTAGGGTIGYMPLEQMRQEALDVRTDEWALASLTYEMLSGSNPFAAPNLQEAQDVIEDAELVLPSLCWDALDASADDVMFTALDPDPDERYESVAAFAEELTPLLGNARAGKRVLAAAVKGEQPEEAPEPEAPREPLPPLVDRLGPKGAAVVARVLAAGSAAMVGAVALVNMRFVAGGVFGLASDAPVAFWVALAVVVALAAWRPSFGALAAYAYLVVMLAANQAFAPALACVVSAGAWWWFVGRRDEGAAVAALLQPLLGSFDLGGVASVVAGALTSVREAAATAAFAACSALVFASLGSASLLGWGIAENALTAASPSIAGASLTSSFVSVAFSLPTWCVAASWVLAATLFSLFCERGTRAFDIAGACVSAVVLLAGVIGAVGVASAGATWLPEPMALVGALVPGALGIVLAVMSVPDRVRLEEGEW